MTGERRFDVVVVGGGITGLTSAYYLKEAGYKVAVLEKGRLAGGESSATTAHLTAVTDSRISELVDSFGPTGAKLVWDAGAIAINAVEQICLKHQIECQFKRVPGFLFQSLTNEEGEIAKLDEDRAAAEKIGVDVHPEVAVPAFKRPGLHFVNQAKFHPKAYLNGLAKTISGKGCAVFEKSEVTEFSSEGEKARFVLTGKMFRLHCDRIVIATHVPIAGLAPLPTATLFQTKLAPYSSYVIGAKLPKGRHAEMLMWDTSDPYYYLRLDRGVRSDYAIFGGLDYKTGQKDDGEARYAQLWKTFQRFFPDATLDARWSGQIVETHDGLPFIGEMVPGQFVATGFAGNGYTFGTFSGLMARDWAVGRENPWQGLFDPRRKELKAGGVKNYIVENSDYPRYLIKDALFPKTVRSTRDIKKGQGSIINLDGKRTACFRDEKGKLFKVSAYCTHMGCTVHFNQAEQTWDCPCHGSRFKPSGEVIGGPAEKPLETRGNDEPASNSHEPLPLST